MTVLRAVAVRLLSLVGVLLLLSLAVFLVQRLLPGDPVRAFVGRTATAAQVAAARTALGYDDPLWLQYLGYLGRLLHGDLGSSLRTRDPVARDIGAYLPGTLELVTAAVLITVVLGVAIGLIGSRSGALAGVVRVVSIAAGSAAAFLVAILVLIVFYQTLGWFPPGGRSTDLTSSGPTGLLLVDTLLAGNTIGFGDALWHLVLPASVLSLASLLAVARTLQGSLRSTLRADFVRSAEAKGQGPWTVRLRHGLRNAAGPALSMLGLQVGVMLAGSVVIELIFSWPGLGGYLGAAIQGADLPAIAGVVLVFGVAYVVINFVVDLLQLLVDPRQRSAA